MRHLAVVVLLLLLAALAASQEFTYSGFRNGGGGGGAGNSPNLTLNGVTELRPDGILRLTNETSRLIGHAFYPSPLRLLAGGAAVSFSTEFAFAVVPEYPKLGGHGLAFVVAPDPRLPGALPSQYLGLLSAADVGNATNHVLAVEFDTVQDFEFGDINDNHVGVDLNSLVSNASASAAPVNLKSGDTIVAWVDYDGGAKLLNVSIAAASASKPASPLISFHVDLSPIFLDQMFVGFSASTGLLASSHYLMGWSFKLGGGAAPPLDVPSLRRCPAPPPAARTARRRSSPRRSRRSSRSSPSPAPPPTPPTGTRTATWSSHGSSTTGHTATATPSCGAPRAGSATASSSAPAGSARCTAVCSRGSRRARWSP